MPRLPRIPDILTTANLSCGVASILLASQGQLTLACWLVFAGAAFDVLDGLAARALGGGSEFGKQLDSLADMVTFGVAPGMLVWFTFKMDLSMYWMLPLPNQLGDAWVDTTGKETTWIIAVAAMMIPVASAWRLAKFNIDTRQSLSFLGLATPANAIFWSSLTLISMNEFVRNGPGSEILRSLLYDRNIFESMLPVHLKYAVLSLLLCILMLSSIPLPSLKFKHFGWKGNEVMYLLLAIGAVLVLLYGILAVPLILLLYLLSPLWGKLFPRTQ